MFCDLRGYTAFTETAEPEEVLKFLREYHGALGPLVSEFEGTLDQFSGDGIMVFFNDPVPCGLRYQYSNYQIEYSRNLVFEVGGHMDQVFQASLTAAARHWT